MQVDLMWFAECSDSRTPAAGARLVVAASEDDSIYVPAALVRSMLLRIGPVAAPCGSIRLAIDVAD